MRNFKKFDIWKKGIQLVKEVYKLAELLPNQEKYGLRSQITRAAVSVPSNIAEGASRNSEIEFKRYLEIAIGSLFELETQILIIQELDLTDSKQVKKLLGMIEEESKMISALIIKIRNS